MFNAQEFVKTLEVPVFVDLAGERHVGKVPPGIELVRLTNRMLKLGEGDAGTETQQVERFTRDVCAAMDLPADKVLEMPQEAVLAAVSYFLRVGRGVRQQGASEGPVGA